MRKDPIVSDSATREYECVEPELGEELWRRDDPDCAPDLAEKLDRHVTVCDACRIERAVMSALDEGLLDETLLDPAPVVRIDPRPLSVAGWTALAASLALALVLPPGTFTVGTTRGDDVPGFARPVEGEVVAGTPDLVWRPVEGATGYTVELDEIGGEFTWSAETVDHRLSSTEQQELPGPGRYRVMVRAVPDDLTPPEGISTTFRRDGARGMVGYRLGASPLPLKILGVAGLALGLLGLGLHRITGGRP